MKRYQEDIIRSDLNKKMVIVVGPRQAGKTWLTKKIASEFDRSVYLNYDNFDHQQIIVQQDWHPNTELLVLDELHKMPNWKNYLKGLYDTKNPTMKLMVTGSARMDAFATMGDSLAGRYFLHHLLPFSPAELHHIHSPIDLSHLLNRSGFPEPFLAESEVDADRWRTLYINSIFATDVFEFDKIQNMNAIRLVFEMLRRRVGSPISYQSIAENVSISANTVKKYIQILEALYIVFKITPYANRIERSIIKAPKIYFFDAGLVVGDEGVKVENLTAISLYKHVLGLNDNLGKNYSLHYIRTKDKKEIDFALALDGKLEKFIEVKLNDKNISSTLIDLSNKLGVEAVQAVYYLQQERMINNIALLRLDRFLESLYL